MNWGDSHKIAGTHCVTCFHLLNHKDHKAFGDHCSDCHSTARMERIGHAIVVGFGFIVRWAFFIASGLAIFLYSTEADWSAFHTKLAELTLSSLFETIVRLALVGLVSSGLCSWAFFRPGEKNYKAWASLGGWVIAIAAWIYMR